MSFAIDFKNESEINCSDVAAFSSIFLWPISECFLTATKISNFFILKRSTPFSVVTMSSPTNRDRHDADQSHESGPV